jgi:hypothetical protein
MSEFSPHGYVALVEGVLARGYRLSGFHDVEASARRLVLRHDVDFDLGSALKLAELEAERGWRATYFVLPRTEFYNLSTPRAQAALSRILALGHAIELHFDPMHYPDDEADLVAGCEREAHSLGGVTGRPVRVFSLHRPAISPKRREIVAPGLINAYGGPFASAIGYCSDSRGEWRHGHPHEHPALAEGRALQLLTHPLWWSGEAEGAPREKLAAFLERRRALLDEEIARNSSIWRTPRSEAP